MHKIKKKKINENMLEIKKLIIAINCFRVFYHVSAYQGANPGNRFPRPPPPLSHQCLPIDSAASPCHNNMLLPTSSLLSRGYYNNRQYVTILMTQDRSRTPQTSPLTRLHERHRSTCIDTEQGRILPSCADRPTGRAALTSADAQSNVSLTPFLTNSACNS